MQQTLLALGAILVFGYLALGRQEHARDVDRNAMQAEIERVAADLARARLTRVEQGLFDEQDHSHVGIRTTPPTSHLGPDAAETRPTDYDDVDDWHGFDTVTTASVGLGSLDFRETVAVRYVEDLDPEAAAAGPTLTKELRVTIEQVVDAEATRPPARVTLRRAITPATTALHHITP